MCNLVLEWLQVLTVATTMVLALALAVIALLVWELRRVYAAAEQLPDEQRRAVFRVLKNKRHEWGRHPHEDIDKLLEMTHAHQTQTTARH